MGAERFDDFDIILGEKDQHADDISPERSEVGAERFEGLDINLGENFEKALDIGDDFEE